jgi:hypothetical protein
MRAITFSVLALIFVAACGNTDRPLRDLRASGGGPDEFSVIPLEPLEIPQELNLPTPTPGGTNRVDPSPNADAIAALGGSAAAQVAGGIPANDAALVAQASRYGVEPAIRAELAAADAARLDRARRSNVFNPLGRDRYFPAYARQALDASAELGRLRALGVAVPNVPVRQQQQQPQQQQSAEQVQETCFWTTAETGIGFRRVCNPVDAEGEQPRAERVEQNCVFTTAGPGSELRRVCTPVEPQAQ